MLETHCAWQNLIFFGRGMYCHKNWENGPKIGIFEFIKRFDHYVLLNVFYNENWYYFLCSNTNPICVKTLVLEIWAKILSGNQITGFLNQLYFQSKSIKCLDFLHFEKLKTTSKKLKVELNFWFEHGQKQVQSVWSWNSKSDCILRLSWWNKLIFCMLVQIQESSKLL